MFRILTKDGTVIHDPTMPEERMLIQPLLLDELNAFGSLEFRQPPEHVCYGKLPERTCYVRVEDEHGVRWRGRIIRTKRCWDNTIETECEGELGYFSDSIQRPFTYYGTVEGMFRQLITAHNAQMLRPDGTADTDRTFAPGICNVPQEDPDEQFYRASESARSTWQLLREKLLQPLGGYLRIRMVNGVRTLDYISEITESSSQPVEYGKNLVSMTVEETKENLITVLIPYGARYEPGDAGYVEPPSSNVTWDGNRRTVRDVNGGSDEVSNASAVAIYGKVYGTKIWDAVYNTQTLLERATQWVDEKAQPEISITAHAVDLSFRDITLDPIRPGLKVHTISAPHDVDQMLLCTRQRIYLMDLSRGDIELGNEKKTLTERMGEIT